MVRAREEPPYVAPQFRDENRSRVPVQAPMPPPQAASSFNPLKIMIPSAVALLVVFVVDLCVDEEHGRRRGEHESTTRRHSRRIQTASQCNRRSRRPERVKREFPSGGTITPPANVNASPNANEAVSPEPD